MPEPLGSDALRSLLDRQAAEQAELERAAVELVAGPHRAAAGAALALSVRRWILLLGAISGVPSPDQAAQAVQVMLDAVTLLARVALPDLRRVAADALAMGVRHGGEQHLAGSGSDIVSAPVSLPADLNDRLRELPDRMERQLAAARNMARRLPPDPDNRDRVVGAAARVATMLESETEIVVARSAGAGIQRVARQARLSTLWVPERDACLDCLAYAGQVSDARGGFPPGLTFGTRPVTWAVRDGRVPGIPLHPRCRCQLCVWSQEWTDGDFPRALEREARRSVVLGFALPSESESARRRAADALLESGAGLPRTVEERARARVRARKRFTRPVPGSRP